MIAPSPSLWARPSPYPCHVSKSKQSRFYVEVYLHGNGAGKGGRETFFLGGLAYYFSIACWP